MAGSLGRATGLAVAFLVSWRPDAVRAQDAAAALLAAEHAVAEASGAAGLASAVAKALRTDAVLVWPGAPVAAGLDAPRLLTAQPSLDSLQLSWQPLGLELSRDTTLGITWGVAPRR